MIVSQLGKVTGIDVEGRLGRRRGCDRSSRSLDQIQLPTLAWRRPFWCCCCTSSGGFRAAPRTADRHAAGRRERWPCSTSIGPGWPWSAPSPGSAVPGDSGLQRARTGNALAGGPRGRHRRLLRQRGDRPGVRRQATESDRQRTRSSWPSARPTWRPGCSRLPGQQQRQPDGDRRRDGQPKPALLAGGMVTVLLTMLFLRPVLGHVPRAALGGVVIYAAIRLIDVARNAAHRPISAQRAGPARLATTAGGVDLRRALRHRRGHRACRSSICSAGSPSPTTGSWATCPGWPACTTSTTTPRAGRCPGWWSTATTPRCSSPTPRTSRPARWRLVDGAENPVEWFLLNAEANIEVDLTALDALDELRQTLAERGIVFAMARVKHELRRPCGPAGSSRRWVRSGSS